MSQHPALQRIEQQLFCPEGEDGTAFAAMMHATNIAMTRAGFAALALHGGEKLLELGHGNAAHLAECLPPAVDYVGLELSPLMQATAAHLNADLLAQNRAAFELYDGEQLPPFAAVFDALLSVNTLYFWNNPDDLLRQLHAALRCGGRIALVYMDADYLRAMPFVGARFRLWQTAEVENLLRANGFSDIASQEHFDYVARKDTGEQVRRRFYVSTATRMAD